MLTGDGFIKTGFWTQPILLGLVDWGSLTAFFRHGAPWYHWLGLFAVNVVLLSATWICWRWLRDRTSSVPAAPPMLQGSAAVAAEPGEREL